MTTKVDKKLRKLIEVFSAHPVCLASWLSEQGISRDLQQYYLKSGWMESVGRGAFKKSGGHVDWRAALHALITQASLDVHVGALTAFSLRGAGQYLRLGQERIFLFSPLGVTLPVWFKKHDWGVNIEHIKTGFLPSKAGVGFTLSVEFSDNRDFQTNMLSDTERAMLECLYLTPKRLDVVECYQLMEGLVNLRPKVVQGLLEACTSIKVKRLFLYMAEKAGHQWLSFIDRSHIELGSGDRSIVDGGVYVSKYHISVPKELAAQ